MRIHPVTSRTRQLSSSAPMVLGWRRPGRVGHCQGTFLFLYMNAEEGTRGDLGLLLFSGICHKMGSVFTNDSNFVARAMLHLFLHSFQYFIYIVYYLAFRLFVFFLNILWSRSVYRRLVYDSWYYYLMKRPSTVFLCQSVFCFKRYYPFFGRR